MQSESNAIKRYNTTSIILHWLLGAGLVAIFVFGLYMADLPFSPQRLKLLNWHKWAGISILALSAVRLVWRLSHPAPALPVAIEKAMPAWQLLAHKGTHLGLYALFFAIPLLGWAYSSAAGFPIVMFGMFPLPDLVGADKPLAETLKSLHKAGAFALALLVLVHVGAALKHQLIDRDGLLKRMSLRG